MLFVIFLETETYCGKRLSRYCHGLSFMASLLGFCIDIQHALFIWLFIFLWIFGQCSVLVFSEKKKEKQNRIKMGQLLIRETPKTQCAFVYANEMQISVYKSGRFLLEF